MKELRMLVWLTQLGLSAAVPLAGFLFLGLWLCWGLGWGSWTIWCGLALGIISGIRGLWDSLKLMEKMSENTDAEKQPPVSFNDHD